MNYAEEGWKQAMEYAEIVGRLYNTLSNARAELAAMTHQRDKALQNRQLCERVMECDALRAQLDLARAELDGENRFSVWANNQRTVALMKRCAEYERQANEALAERDEWKHVANSHADHIATLTRKLYAAPAKGESMGDILRRDAAPEHQHTDECWEPDSGCDMGRNEKYAAVAAPEAGP